MKSEIKHKRRASSVNTFTRVLKELKLTTAKISSVACWQITKRFQNYGPLGRTERKLRTKSKNMCCDNLGCDPMWPNTPAKKKLRKRMELGLCRGCGNKPIECRCRRKT